MTNDKQDTSVSTMLPLLVIVSGPSATGKTTLAKKLGDLKSLPVICKDDIKESLFDSLGYETPEKVEQLEAATYDLLFQMTHTILKASQSLIIESDVTTGFNENKINELKTESDFKILQISCHTDGDILIKRFKKRMPTQHPGHYEAYYWEHSPEFRESLRRGFGETLDVEGEIISVDTTDFDLINYDQLLSKIYINNI